MLKGFRAGLIASATLTLLSASSIFAAEFSNGTTKAGTGYIVISGEIGQETPDIFESYAEILGEKFKVVMLDSPGGSVIGGVGLGEVIRNRGFMTVVPGGSECLSACAFAYMGGTHRSVFEGGRLGMHQFRWEDEIGSARAVETSQSYAGVLIAYFSAMGIDQRALTIAMMTPSSSMHYFTRRELVEFGLEKAPPPQPSAAAPCPFPKGHDVQDALNLFPQCK